VARKWFFGSPETTAPGSCQDNTLNRIAVNIFLHSFGPLLEEIRTTPVLHFEETVEKISRANFRVPVQSSGYVLSVFD